MRLADRRHLLELVVVREREVHLGAWNLQLIGDPGKCIAAIDDKPAKGLTSGYGQKFTVRLLGIVAVVD